MHLIAILLIFSNQVITTCGDTIIIKANGGIHFDHVIEKEKFFANESNVRFSAALAGLSDLPKWINLAQTNDEGDAVLYGTPSRDDIGKHELEIVGWNRQTYDTTTKKIMFTVNHHDILSVLHQFEFLVKNKDITDMFQEGGSFLRAVQEIWDNARYITLMEKVSQRSPGNKPLPGAKEGVHIQIGGQFQPSSQLKFPSDECANIDKDLEQIMTGFGFDIDWCKSKYISSDDSKPYFEPSNELYSTSMNTELFRVSRENHILDIAYCFLPIIIGVSFIVILTCVMCFHSDDGYSETDSSTNDGSFVSSKSYLPVNTNSTDAPGKDARFAYGPLDESLREKSSSKPPAYKMPPTRIPVDVSNKKMVLDTGI